jgi:hypothetical protein
MIIARQDSESRYVYCLICVPLRRDAHRVACEPQTLGEVYDHTVDLHEDCDDLTCDNCGKVIKAAPKLEGE